MPPIHKNTKISLKKKICQSRIKKLRLMELKTPVDIPEYGFEITHKDKAFFIGSCFTEHIGKKLKSHGFSAVVNPFGTVYNPVSVANSLDLIIDNKKFTEKDLSYHNGLWFSFFHNTNFSNIDKGKCLKKINHAMHDAHDFLKKTDCLFITLGTAYVYEKREEKYVVSNCHKLPPQHFNRYLLDVADICRRFNDLTKRLKKINPGIRIIITVSPIRHLKDGAQGNQVSKSTLLLASHRINGQEENTYYFPAYEIVMDELRDYRFYAPDMIHLNTVAVEYIWEKFMRIFLSLQTQQVVGEIEKLNKVKTHKPAHSQSEAYKHFIAEGLKKAIALKEKYPAVDVDGYIKFFREQLESC